jgi:hypothetical protein
MKEQTRNFDISDVLSITTGKLVSTRHVDGVYDILNHMTGDNLFTHALPRASRACAPVLLDQHPQLKEVDAADVNTENWQPWLAAQRARYGDSFDVTPLAEWRHKHPITEAIEMMGPDRVIQVSEARDE